MKPGNIFSHWKQIRSELFSTIDKVDDDDLTYTLFDNSWSVGQIMLHYHRGGSWVVAIIRYARA